MKKSLVSVVSWLLVIVMMISVMPMAAFAADAGTHEHYDPTTETGLSAHMKEVTEKTVEGTCEHGESKTYKCEICGYTTPALTKPRDLNGTGCKYVVVKDKTDSEKITYQCETCGDVRVCKIHEGILYPDNPTADENHKWVKHVQSPTCTAYGYTYVTCNVDGCTLTHIVANSYVAPAHTFNDWKITKYATSGANGVEQRTCQVCGHVETRSTDKTAPTPYTARIKYDLTPVYTQASTSDGAAYLLAKGFEFTPADTFIDSDEWCAFSHASLGTGTYYVKTASIQLNPSSVPTSTAYPGLQYVGTIVSSVPMKVRLGASTDSAELYSLPYNSTIYVYQKNTDGWMKIKPDKDEWICGSASEISLVQVIGAGSLPQEDTRTVVDTGTVTASAGIKVRDGASTDSAQVGTLPKGTTITFYEAHVKDPSGLKWGVIQAADFAKYGLTSSKDKLYVDLSYVSLASLGGSTASNTAVATGTVSSNINLNVRKEPKITITNKVGSLTNGTKVTLYEMKNGWGRIDQDGMKGWISLQYVILDSGSTGDSTATETNATVVNCSRAVNVRSEAKVTSNLVTTIPVNTRIAVTKQSGQWFYVSGTGWVYGDYVSLDDGALEKSDTSSGKPITTYTNVSVNATVTASDTLAVYATPNDGSTVLAKLPTGTEFTIVDRTIAASQIWAKVTFGDLVGWVKADSGTSGSVTYPAVSGTVNASSINVYSSANIDSSVIGVLGSGTKITIAQDSQYVDGVYVWGKLSSVSGFVMLHQLKLDVKSTGTVDSLTVSPAITGTVSASADMRATPSASATKVLVLEQGASVSISEWKYAEGATWGKVTKGDFTGWIKIFSVENGKTKAYVTQNEVTGTVNADMVNLYNNYDATEVQQVLRSGAKVTIAQRALKDNAVWGKVITSDGKEYWGNLAGITLAGANISTAAPTTPSDSTGTGTGNGAVTTPTTGVAGTVVNTDSLNVRSAAGARNTKVTTLKRGTAVTVYEQTTTDGALWGRIDQGWVAMTYVDLSSKSTGTTSTVTGGVAAGGTTIMTTVPSGAVAVGFVNYVNEVNIRAGAGQGYAKVGTLKKGANVVIYEQKLEGGMIWGRIDQGWICTSYVTMTGASVTGAGTAGTIARCFFTANVRSSPGVGNALVGKIMVNSRVEILETRTYSGEQWGRTSIGWINMNYVLLDGAAPIL